MATWPPGVYVAASGNGRLNLRKTDDKRLPWIVVDLQQQMSIYSSDSKKKALSMMNQMASRDYKTAADLAHEAEVRERAINMAEGAREHARKIAAGELVRGPIIAGVQMWHPAKQNPSHRIDSKRAPVAAALRRMKQANENGYYLDTRGWYRQDATWRANEAFGGNGGRDYVSPSVAARLNVFVAGRGEWL